ncbi:MAG: ADOP family duplicated permease [Gemmatimonadaceae bacterium]|nr:ADOP family duplicated permease [Gemmatimonadaceae bacterium]
MTHAIADVELRAFAEALADRYDALAPLGAGGMAELLVGTERQLDRRVVIKRIARHLTTGEARDRFEREIAVLATLQHPGIVPLLSAGTVGDTPYFVMPLVRGESLADRLRRGPLSVREAVAVLADVARALECAHAAGVAHRDIKPGNILLTGRAAVVADFGIAKALGRGGPGRPVPLRTPTDLTLEGYSLGTPRYMAPEQFAGDAAADHRVDLYALGVVGYELLAGAPPFDGATPSALARAHLSDAPPSIRTRRADVPPALEALLLRCLAKDPAERPAGARELLRVLTSPSLLAAGPGGDRASAAAGGGHPAGALRRELRHGWRALARTPALFSACLLCLALGIASVASVFSVVDAVMLAPLPFREPDRLVSVFRSVRGVLDQPHSAPNALDLAEDPTLAGFGAFASTSSLVAVGDRIAPVHTVRVTGALFGTLGVTAQHGRLLTPADDDLGSAPVVVVGHDYWREQFGANPGVIGTPLRIDGVAHEIVGVLPPRFRIPNAGSIYDGDLWVPIRFTPRDREARTSNYLRAVARLAPGVSAAAAEQALQRRFAGIVERFPALEGASVHVRALPADASVTLRAPLLLLLVSTLVVLAIAGLNVSSLLLARGIRRRAELAVRAALGASRWEVMRPVLVESAIIAAGGWGLGVALAIAVVRGIVLLGAERIVQLADARVDLRVIAAAGGVSLLAALAGSLAPAWQAARTVPADALRGGQAAGGRHQHRALGALVVAEGALALALLIAAGLVLKGFVRIIRGDPGFEPAGLLTLHVRVSPTDFPGREPADRFLAPALEAVSALPGVRAAGAISQLPYQEWGWNAWVRYEGSADVPLAQRPLVETRNITPGFFAATGQRLLAGRLPDAREMVATDGPPKVVVNAALVARDFRDRDPLGQRFLIGDEPQEIIGVVSDIRNFGPVERPRPEAYWTFAQRQPGATGLYLVVRTVSDDPMAVAGAVDRALRAVHPGVAIARVRPMQEVMQASVGWPRFVFALFSALATVALVLAVAGLFGLLHYTVEQRRREFGLRAALGAPPARLARDVLRSGGALLVPALLIGLALGWALTRYMSSVLFGLDPMDPPVWGTAALAVAAAGLAASSLPARRAGRTAPMVAMRGD